jgi:hypothetical protein
MTNFSTSTYADVASQLAAVETWLTGFGISVAPTRIGYYRRRLDALIAAHAAGTIEQDFSREEVSEFILMFGEVQELIFVQRHLSQEANLGLPDKLRDVISGPALTRGEVPESAANRARNILFELTLAATLVAAGFPILPSGVCDLCTSFEGRRVMIECKRPQSDRKVERLVKDGMKQLNTRLAQEPAESFGLLAVSISKLISGGTHVIRTATREEIQPELIAKIDAFIQTHGLSWNIQVPPAMVGVILHAGATGIPAVSGGLYTGKQYSICAIEQQPEEQVQLSFRFAEQFARALSSLRAENADPD